MDRNNLISSDNRAEIDANVSIFELFVMLRKNRIPLSLALSKPLDFTYLTRHMPHSPLRRNFSLDNDQRHLLILSAVLYFY